MGLRQTYHFGFGEAFLSHPCLFQNKEGEFLNLAIRYSCFRVFKHRFIDTGYCLTNSLNSFQYIFQVKN